MATAAKAKPEGLLGLSQNEARLILLGVLYSDASGKVSYALSRPFPLARACLTHQLGD